ncbi:hypothetical protein ABLE92_12255 [Gordonia sp. VNQ95]|uniref:hypothetical protein n=1 Tax=Gordonia sp. VNQ95 TaxID=3156619 RepID=UPI0032B4AA7C
MTDHHRRSGRALLTTLVTTLVLAISAAPAAAAPGDPVQTTLGWRQLGLGTSVQITAADAPQTIGIPVPDGTRPTTLTGVVASAVNVTDAFLQVTHADGTILGTIEVPAFGPDQRSIPFTVPLTGLPVLNGHTELRVTLRNPGIDAICGPTPEVNLANLAVAYAGTETAPTTIEQFFGPVLNTITLYVPPDPSSVVAQTVVDLVTALTGHYRPQRVTITVAERPTSGDPPTRGPLDRAVVIDQTDGAGGIGLRNAGQANAYLQISGNAQALPIQTALFRDDMTALAQTDSVAVTGLGQREVQGSDVITFGQFSDRLSAEVLGTTTLVPGFNPTQLALGRPGQVRIHLRATYTPVRQDERATMLAVSGGQVLDTATLDQSGSLDTDFLIPAPQVAANAPLELRLSYEPAPAACTPRTVPLTFQIDPSSTAQAEATPVQMGGFSSVPLGWQPSVQVALTEGDTYQLSIAAALLASVQRTSATPISPIVVPLDQAIASSSGALIIADAAAAHPLNPPVNVTEATTTVALPQQVRLQIPGGLGTIQAFGQDSRTVLLVSTSGPWTLVDPLMGYLDASDGELGDLRGDVLVAGRDRQARLLTVRADGPVTLVSDVGNAWVLWVAVSAILLALIGAGGVAVTVIRRRRGGRVRRPSTDPPDTDDTAVDETGAEPDPPSSR